MNIKYIKQYNNESDDLIKNILILVKLKTLRELGIF